MDNSVIYNRIYARALEWGSSWRRPILEIVQEEYPFLSDEEQEQISKYLKNCPSALCNFQQCEPAYR